MSSNIKYETQLFINKRFFDVGRHLLLTNRL